MKFRVLPFSWMIGVGFPMGAVGMSTKTATTHLFVVALGPMRWTIPVRRQREEDA